MLAQLIKARLCVEWREECDTGLRNMQVPMHLQTCF